MLCNLILLHIHEAAFQSTESSTWPTRQRRIKVYPAGWGRILPIEQGAQTKIPSICTLENNLWYFHLFLIVEGSKYQIENKNHLSKAVIRHKSPYYLAVRTERERNQLSENLLWRKQWEPMRKCTLQTRKNSRETTCRRIKKKTLGL